MAAETIERLASESAEARTKLAATIDEIQERLDPRRVVSDVVSRASDTGRTALSSATGTVKEHPVAIGTAILAVGLALLARNRLSKATINLGDQVGDYTDYDDGFGYDEQASIADDSVTVKRPIIARAGEGVDDYPIVSIVLGLTAGAVLGVLFPTTDTERRLMGSVSGKLSDAARKAVDAMTK